MTPKAKKWKSYHECRPSGIWTNLDNGSLRRHLPFATYTAGQLRWATTPREIQEWSWINLNTFRILQTLAVWLSDLKDLQLKLEFLILNIVISSSFFNPFLFQKWLEKYKKWKEWKKAVITFAHAALGNKQNYDWRALPKKIWRHLLDVQQWGKRILLQIELVSKIDFAFWHLLRFFGNVDLFWRVFILTENFLTVGI